MLKSDWVFPLTILQYVVFIALYLSMWISPSSFSNEFIMVSVTLIFFEFVLMHSGLFMMGKVGVILFFPIYFAAAYKFNAIVPGNTILYVYLIQIVFRFLNTNSQKSKSILPFLKSWASAFGAYVPAIVATVILASYLPYWGLNLEVQEGIGVGNVALHHAMFFAVFYYSILIVWEFYFQKKDRSAISIMIIAEDEIGTIIKSKLTSAWDTLFSIHPKYPFDLSKVQSNYRFDGRFKKKFNSDARYTDLSQSIDLVIIAGDLKDNASILKQVDQHKLSVLDISSAIDTVKPKVLEEYKTERAAYMSSNEEASDTKFNAVKREMYDRHILPAVLSTNGLARQPLNSNTKLEVVKSRLGFYMARDVVLDDPLKL